MVTPGEVQNLIGGAEAPAERTFEKRRPADGELLCSAARSSGADVDHAVGAARAAYPAWAATPGVQRGMALFALIRSMQDAREEIAQVVAAETGKSLKDARGEADTAIQLGLFFASEGQRLYGRTTTSGVANRTAMTWRTPLGVAGLIVASNTPIANVAWKAFPALVCGNAAVLKGSEDTPLTAWLFGRLATEAGLPAGVLNVVHGLGAEAGAALAAHAGVDVVSFTGSTETGRKVQGAASARMARVSLELGGKNPLVVCDDADLEKAVRWILLSGYSNAGQRCAAASRVIVFEGVYDAVRGRLIEAVGKLKVGPRDEDDLGPVISQWSLERLVAALMRAKSSGVTVLAGGGRLDRTGYYFAPTLLEDVPPDHEVSCTELFGPVVALYRAKNFEDALAMANASRYGLSACIHTRSMDRAMRFALAVEAGVAVVNGGTHGSEPHMPFGGRKLSGNGTREPGTEALDVYSELKDVYVHVDPGAV